MLIPVQPLVDCDNCCRQHWCNSSTFRLGHPFGPFWGLPARPATVLLNIGIIPTTIQLPGSLCTSSWMLARDTAREKGPSACNRYSIRTYTSKYVQTTHKYIRIRTIRTFSYLAIFSEKCTYLHVFVRICTYPYVFRDMQIQNKTCAMNSLRIGCPPVFFETKVASLLSVRADDNRRILAVGGRHGRPRLPGYDAPQHGTAPPFD